MAFDDLTIAAGTLRRASFPDRVAAASAAGADSVGLTSTDYRTLLAQGWTDEEMRAVLDRWGITLAEAEVIAGFWLPPGTPGAPAVLNSQYNEPAVESHLFRLADEFGIDRIQAIGQFGTGPIGPEVVDAFGELCDRAAVHAVRIALEFIPSTNIATLANALGIVRQVNRPNGGICLDSWHFYRGDPDLDVLAGVDPGEIHMLQINDRPTDPAGEVAGGGGPGNRVCPGEGDLPLEEFISTALLAGVDAPVSIEVFSDQLDRLPSVESAARAVDGTRAVIDRARQLAAQVSG